MSEEQIQTIRNVIHTLNILARDPDTEYCHRDILRRLRNALLEII